MPCSATGTGTGISAAPGTGEPVHTGDQCTPGIQGNAGNRGSRPTGNRGSITGYTGKRQRYRNGTGGRKGTGMAGSQGSTETAVAPGNRKRKPGTSARRETRESPRRKPALTRGARKHTKPVPAGGTGKQAVRRVIHVLSLFHSPHKEGTQPAPKGLKLPPPNSLFQAVCTGQNFTGGNFNSYC